MKPRLLADTKWACWVEIDAPSELLTSGLASKAACSQRRAVSIGLLDAQRPRVVQIEIGAIPGHQRRIGQAGAIVLGGEAGDVQRRLDRFAQCLRREIGGAGVTLALTGIDRDADALVTIELDGFDLVTAHRHRLPEALRDIDLAGRRPLVAGVLEHILGELLQGGEGVGKCGGFGHGEGRRGGKIAIITARH